MKIKNDNHYKNEVKKTDDQTNIEKYRIAANIIEYQSYYIKINLPKNHHSKIHDDYFM